MVGVFMRGFIKRQRINYIGNLELNEMRAQVRRRCEIFFLRRVMTHADLGRPPFDFSAY